MLSVRSIRVLGVAASALGALYVQPVRPVIVSGNSMMPTYHTNEVVLTSSKIGSLEKGDVVVVRNQSGTYLKRLAFVPGDTILQFRQHNGKWIDLIRVRATKNSIDNIRAYKVPMGHYYVLGDNLELSVDSREFGVIYGDQIIGKVLDQREWPEESKPIADPMANIKI